MDGKRMNSPEEWADEALGQMASGGNLQVYRNFGYLFTKVFATYVWVFLRYRFGVYVVNLRSIWWGGIVLMILGMISSFGHAEQEGGSGSYTFYGWHLTAFVLAALYHSYEANRNLRRRDGKGEMRNGYDTGESHLWYWLKNLVNHTEFSENRFGHWICERITYFRVQKWLEPLLVIGIGMIFRAAGFDGYGLFLIICGISVHLVSRMEERAYYEFKQQNWDAMKTSGEMPATQQAQHTPGGVVAPPHAKRKPGHDFEQWKKEKAQKRDFETAETHAPENQDHTS